MNFTLEEEVKSCLEQALWSVGKETKIKPWIDVRQRFREEARKLIERILPKDKGFRVPASREWRGEPLDVHFFNDEELHVIQLAWSKTSRGISQDVVIGFWRKLEKFQSFENRARKRRIFAYLCANKRLSDPAYAKYKSLENAGKASVHLVKPQQSAV